jgi:hypothetical protein
VSKGSCIRFVVTLVAAVTCFPFIALGQDAPDAPVLKNSEKADILFVATAPDTDKDQKGKPALASLDPVAFVVGNELRDCAPAHPKQGEDSIPKITTEMLSSAYAAGNRFALWWAGAPWGTAEAVSSCIDSDLDLLGCAHLHPDKNHSSLPADFKGTAWTGPPPTASHTVLRVRAGNEDKAIFLKAATAAFASRHVPTVPQDIHAGQIWRVQLRAGHTALVGSTLVQLASKEPRTYYSYHLFLVAEENGGTYLPVLAHYHRSVIVLDSSEALPKRGEVLAEDNGADQEEFVDSFPLFAGEPDAVISSHTYYESWAYSVYRRVGDHYQHLYTGCGGGS